MIYELSGASDSHSLDRGANAHVRCLIDRTTGRFATCVIHNSDLGNESEISLHDFLIFFVAHHLVEAHSSVDLEHQRCHIERYNYCQPCKATIA